MTEKRIIQIAAKLRAAYRREIGSKAELFSRLPLSIQSAWIAAARIAVAELKGGKRAQRVRKVK